MRYMTTLFGGLFTTAVLLAGVPGEIHSGRLTYTIDLSKHDPKGEAELWLPYPVSDPDQTITDVLVSGDYVASAVYTDKHHGAAMLYAKWLPGAKSRKLTFAFTAERKEVLRRQFPPKEAAWDQRDYALYLAPTHMGPLDGAVGKLAGQITQGRTTVVDKAKAIYQWTCENTYRDPATRGCGEGNVCALLNKPGGKCVDINSLFVALARAAGVPSREIFGIRLGKGEKPEDATGFFHCWAEFYAPGYGWVPVDPADVRKAMLTEKLEGKDPKAQAHQAYFWGGIDPYRVKLSTGRDLMLNPFQPGKALNYFMYPFARVGNQIVDWLDPANFQYKVSYTR